MEVIGGRLQGIGQVGTTTNFAGGIIAPGNSIGTLTVAGNYVGNGGLLEIETVLGDDGSATDMLVVTGDTSGSTNVRVINLGGAGAQTIEGIRIVDVGGRFRRRFYPAGELYFRGRSGIGCRGLCLSPSIRGVSARLPTVTGILRSALIDGGTPTGAALSGWSSGLRGLCHGAAELQRT
jgi:hypothetical protein